MMEGEGGGGGGGGGGGEGIESAYVVVLVIQTLYVGMYLLTKFAFDDGMNTAVFVVYRQASAALFLAPIAFFFQWKTSPPLSFTILIKIFMVSLCGITATLNLYGVALKYTSATLASATTNAIPVVTFILALILRLEKANLRTLSGIAKVAGLALCTGGAVTMALYSGPTFKLLLHHHLIPHHDKSLAHNPSSGQHWVKGVLLMLLSNCCWSFWIVAQGHIVSIYPSKLMNTALQCIFSTIQSFVVAIALVRNPEEWKLGWNLKLLTVLYCGVVVTGFTFYLQSWVVEKKGPLFLAMTTPLNLIITILSSAIFLGEILALGSILGAILLIGGLYSVLWGKIREEKEEKTTKVDIENENNARNIAHNTETNESGQAKRNARDIEHNAETNESGRAKRNARDFEGN